MTNTKIFRKVGCKACAEGAELEFDFSMAFQPIVSASSKAVFAYEALARGIGDQPFSSVFEKINDNNIYAFDQACRTKAISLAAKLGIDTMLSINFMPNAVYRPELCIRATLHAAEKHGFPLEKLMFEVTESERVTDVEHLRSVIDYYRTSGFTTSLDDFGAGYSGLNLLADLDVDVLKIDMYLIRDIDTNIRKKAILSGIVKMARDMGLTLVAEGVETLAEYQVIRELGIDLFQGYLFARPTYEALPNINWHVMQQ